MIPAACAASGRLQFDHGATVGRQGGPNLYQAQRSADVNWSGDENLPGANAGTYLTIVHEPVGNCYTSGEAVVCRLSVLTAAVQRPR